MFLNHVKKTANPKRARLVKSLKTKKGSFPPEFLTVIDNCQNQYDDCRIKILSKTVSIELSQSPFSQKPLVL